MLTGDEHEDVHERESERIDGLEADMISALRPPIRRSRSDFSYLKVDNIGSEATGFERHRI